MAESNDIFDTVVIGGGIAGLAMAALLRTHGAGRVLLLEQEQLLASHSSGRNAAIFRHVDDAAAPVAWAVRSRALLDEMFATQRWLSRVGAVYTAVDEAGIRGLDAMRAALASAEMSAERLGRESLQMRVPALAGGEASAGLWVPDDGVIDVHAVTSQLAALARRAGACLKIATTVRQIDVQADRVAGVILADGTRIVAGTVVVAAGAWSAELGRRSAVGLPLTPWRRHLALLDSDTIVAAAAPVVWHQGEGEVYLRYESGGLLACPCDATPWHPCVPATDAEALVQLGRRLQSLAPRLASARVRRTWACLRTFAPDRGFVLGPDPRLRGLSWCAGLGGHGMTAGVAAAEVVARAIVDSSAVSRIDARWRPDRFRLPCSDSSSLAAWLAGAIKMQTA